MVKSLVVAPFIPISSFMASHRAAQGVIYADQLVQNGEDVTINFGGNVVHDFNAFDRVYVYHGNDWRGTLNLYGGPEKFPYAWNFRNLTLFKGEVISLVHEFPDYHGLLTFKLDSARKRNKKILPEWDECDFDNLLKMQKSPVIKYPRVTPSIVIGDSHAICMYRPGWTINSVPFKTLFGALKDDMFYDFVMDPYDDPSQVENVELYFGNIDIRHHLARQPAVVCATIELVGRYVKAAENLYQKLPNLKSVKIYEPLPIESEERPIPTTGYFMGTPFYGSWEERDGIRQMFVNELRRLTSESDKVESVDWTKYLLNDKGELAMEYMEYKKSVHLSRANYPHWTGVEYNATQIKGRSKGIPKVIASKTASLEDFL